MREIVIAKNEEEARKKCSFRVGDIVKINEVSVVTLATANGNGTYSCHPTQFSKLEIKDVVRPAFTVEPE